MLDPLAAQRATLQQLRWRSEQLLTVIANRPTGHRPPLDQVHRELLAGIGGTLTSEFFGRRRIGSSVGRAIAANAQAAQRQREHEAVRGEANDLIRETRQLVDSVSRVLGTRTTQSLQRVLAEAESAHRPDTSLRRVLEAVGRLEVWQLPPSSAKASQLPSEELQSLERELRRCIEQRLSRLTVNWWVERVPEEVRSRAERRKLLRERVWPWLDGEGHRSVEYLDFPDYAKVILDSPNWSEAFAPLFIDRDALRVKLRELEPIRNDVAHSRQITRANTERLRLYAREIIEQVNR